MRCLPKRAKVPRIDRHAIAPAKPASWRFFTSCLVETPIPSRCFEPRNSNLFASVWSSTSRVKRSALSVAAKRHLKLPSVPPILQLGHLRLLEFARQYSQTQIGERYWER